jgi:hypothetical protein
MEIFYIPFNPDSSHGWTVPIPRDGERQFASRSDALAFARQIAKEETAVAGTKNYLCVEGGDKMWRLFTADLMRVN